MSKKQQQSVNVQIRSYRNRREAIEQQKRRLEGLWHDAFVSSGTWLDLAVCLVYLYLDILEKGQK